jgi:hypothetical protein
MNKYKHNIDDKNPYVTLPIIIKTEEVKNLLKENGYIIDKVSNDIEVNTTRIWIDKDLYREAIKNNHKQPLAYSDYGKITQSIKQNNEKEDINTIKIKSIDKENNEEKVNMFDQILASILGYSNFTELQEAIKKTGDR